MSLRKSKRRESFDQLHSSIISTMALECTIDTSTRSDNDDFAPRRGSMSPRASIPFPYKPSQHRLRELQSQELQEAAAALWKSVHPLDDFSLWFHLGTVLKLSWRLITLLVHGTSIWMIKMLRLLCFVVALFPAFIVFGGFYFVTSDRIVVPYLPDTPHRTSRHYLDIYGSSLTLTCQGDENLNNKKKKKPVVVFLTGGAWVIGYKMWGALMARTLVPFGILLVIPDYRNFPQTNIEGMIDDADRAIEWTLQNIHKYGGDPNSLVIAGQSAGAHIGACLLLAKAQLDAPVGHSKASAPAQDSNTTRTNKTNNNATTNSSTTNTTKTRTTWHALHIRGFLCVSGPYDLVAMRDILHKNGLDKSIVNAMFCNNVAQYSPTLMARELAASASASASDNNKTNTSAPNHNQNNHNNNHVQNNNDDNNNSKELLLLLRVRKHFPATCVIHGEADKTVPFQISLEFFEALKELQLEESVEFRLYPSWSHTDPILEAPFAGNHLFHQDAYNLVKRWTTIETTTIGTTASSTKEKVGADNNQEEVEDDNGPLELLPFDETHEACQKICPLFLENAADRATRRQLERARTGKSRRVAKAGTYYPAVFLVSWLPTFTAECILARVMANHQVSKTGWYVLFLIVFFVWPAQGFFNFLVYCNRGGSRDRRGALGRRQSQNCSDPPEANSSTLHSVNWQSRFFSLSQRPLCEEEVQTCDSESLAALGEDLAVSTSSSTNCTAQSDPKTTVDELVHVSTDQKFVEGQEESALSIAC